MAITSKPKPIEESAAFKDFVHKGGSATQAEPEPAKKRTMVLRLPDPLWEKVDRLRSTRLAKVSRNQWILEAIEQRIEREEPVNV